jgi:hypothetical protein
VAHDVDHGSYDPAFTSLSFFNHGHIGVRRGATSCRNAFASFSCARSVQAMKSSLVAFIFASVGFLPSQPYAQCLPQPGLSISRAPMVISLKGQTNFNYAIEGTANFGAWDRLITNRSATAMFTFSLPAATSPYRFFRSLEVSASDGGGSFWLFDGQTETGWIPDSAFRIQNCAYVGGSLASQLPDNHFISTTRMFTNFVLRLKFKLVGLDGFINGGVQFRSARLAGGLVGGYQADMGDAYWGSLYDENRRNAVLVNANQPAVEAVLHKNDWNDYAIKAEGSRIQLFINGLKTVDFLEADASIPLFGIIALQIHSGARAEASYKEISIEEL